MEVVLSALGHEDQDGASVLSGPVQQRLKPPALLRPPLLSMYRCPGFVEEFSKKKLRVYVEICSSARYENPWAFSMTPLWLFMTLALAPLTDLRSSNFSSVAKEKALRILNDFFSMKFCMKLATGIAQTPKPPNLPDQHDYSTL